jgi:hypothetical protein
VYPRSEGELFLGLVPWTLCLVAAMRLAWSEQDLPARSIGPWRRRAGVLLVLILVVQVVGLVGLLLSGGFVTSFFGLPVRATNAPRLLAAIALVGMLLMATDPHARARARRAVRTPLALALMLLVLAVWLSLGPRPQSLGRPLPGLGLYGVLYETVPGFDGLRVPARYAMIAALFVSVAAGFGLATLLRRLPRPPLAAAVVAVVFLIEAAFLPMTRNAAWGDGPVQPPPRIEPAGEAPAVYRRLATLETAAVVAEFPFGDPAWELRYVYYSTVHWKRLVNGYSGGFPHGYLVRAAQFARIAEGPDEAWRTLVDAGTTHVIVHESAMPAAEARLIAAWLAARGAVVIDRFDRDILYAIPRATP